MNLHKLGHKFKTKLLVKRAESLTLLKHFKLVAREVIQQGGNVSFEWPRHCSGWKLTELTSFIEKFKLFFFILMVVQSESNPKRAIS